MFRALLSTALLLCLGAPAAAEEPSAAADDATRSVRSRFVCTPYACRPDRGAPVSHALGFAGVSLAAGWIGRGRARR